MRGVAPNSLAFTLLIGALAGLPPLSTDMSLPSVGLIQQELHASPAQGTMVVSLFFAGFGLAQLFFGPLSDWIGRRPVLLGSMTLYTLAGAGCALSNSIAMLLICRFIHGIGAAGGTVLAFAIVRDVYHGPAARARLSTISMVFSLAPIAAPTLGGLLVAGGWRLVFVVLSVGGALLVTGVALGLSETRRPRPRNAGFYGPVLRERRTMGFAITGALNGSSILAFVIGSPVVLMDGMDLTPTQFAVVFAVIAAGIVTGSAVNRRLVTDGVPSIWPLGIGLGIAACASLALCMFAALGESGLAVMMPLLLLNTLCRGVVGPNVTHAALEPLPSHAGAASAVMGSLQMVMGAFSGILVGVLYPWLGPGAMGAVMASFALASLIAWLVTERGA